MAYIFRTIILRITIIRPGNELIRRGGGVGGLVNEKFPDGLLA